MEQWATAVEETTRAKSGSPSCFQNGRPIVLHAAVLSQRVLYKRLFQFVYKNVSSNGKLAAHDDLELTSVTNKKKKKSYWGKAVLLCCCFCSFSDLERLKVDTIVLSNKRKVTSPFYVEQFYSRVCLNAWELTHTVDECYVN